jgi:hypothetical protein
VSLWYLMEAALKASVPLREKRGPPTRGLY